jgi:hypothetical protein
MKGKINYMMQCKKQGMKHNKKESKVKERHNLAVEPTR